MFPVDTLCNRVGVVGRGQSYSSPEPVVPGSLLFPSQLPFFFCALTLWRLPAFAGTTIPNPVRVVLLSNY